ncbi:DUF1440 domain-containing protein [Nocardiopsis sp. FR26]|uniref:DUF1440 domain-containing protein n=1 Tax=Nocardiopsis sp. FR26 TaxID=2605987 RepID=UPI00135A7256|nr:DUF1440 domain-containing protein [Nocardiopsis sp. FR26]
MKNLVTELAKDLVTAPLAGYLASRVMEPVSMKLYEHESEADRACEDQARPGMPFRIAAEKTTRLLRQDLSEPQLDKAGMAFHYGLGVSWAPVYALIRRTTPLGPVNAGLASGAAMSLSVDEGLTPLLGFSASNRDYPLVTHARGFFTHLAFGLATAAVTETVWCLTRRRP